jgi:hypothetical protein
MTVADLRRLLDELPPEAIVVLAKDSEGNDFSPLADHGTGTYTPRRPWSGEFTPDPAGDSFPAVCLWPTN